MPRPGGLLDASRARLRITPAAVAAALAVCGILYGLYAFLHYMQVHLVDRPFLCMLLPPITVACFAVALPLMMFISFQDDFKGLFPLHPVHYTTIARRCYTALGHNNLRVSEKDL